jgi:hypothetical protein
VRPMHLTSVMCLCCAPCGQAHSLARAGDESLHHHGPASATSASGLAHLDARTHEHPPCAVPVEANPRHAAKSSQFARIRADTSRCSLLGLLQLGCATSCYDRIWPHDRVPEASLVCMLSLRCCASCSLLCVQWTCQQDGLLKSWKYKLHSLTRHGAPSHSVLRWSSGYLRDDKPCVQCTTSSQRQNCHSQLEHGEGSVLDVCQPEIGPTRHILAGGVSMRCKTRHVKNLGKCCAQTVLAQATAALMSRRPGCPLRGLASQQLRRQKSFQQHGSWTAAQQQQSELWRTCLPSRGCQ